MRSTNRVGRFLCALLLAAFALPGGVARAETLFQGQTFEIFGPNDPNLDLSGAVIGLNAGGGADTVVNGVNFLSETTAALSGVTVTGSTAGQGTPNFGGSADQVAFAGLFATGRHADPDFNVPVTPGHLYKIQMLTSEHTYAAGGRGMDVYLEGTQVADELPVFLNDGRHQSAFQANSATAYTVTYLAGNNNLDFDLRSATTFADNNPYAQALTLEDLGPSGTIGTFTGGDPGEGLDLQGNFRFAVNARGGGGLVIGNAKFRDEAQAGAPIAADNEINGWGTLPEYGASTSDNNLETVMHSIRWSDANGLGPNSDSVNINVPIVAGRDYKLQLLFSENAAGNRRTMDVTVEGEKIVDEFVPQDVHGTWGVAPNTGAVITRAFKATDATLNVSLSPGNGQTSADQNPILQGFTLEDLSVTTTTFSGADPGEGLDLTGNFPVAVNVGGAAATAGNVQFADNSATDPAGVTITAENHIPGWINPDYGPSAGDNGLETVMQSIRWTATGNGGIEDLQVAVNNMVPGADYKLQLLFGDGAQDRGFNVFVNGEIAAANFNSNVVRAGDATKGVVLTQTLRAANNSLTFTLNGAGVADGDTNPILNGFTLENLSTTVGTFTGGDAGEGLDLDGQMVYAMNVGGPAVTIRSANFFDNSSGNVPAGVTLVAENHIPNWLAPNFGATPDDDALETVMSSIRWSSKDNNSPDTIQLDLANLVVGQEYKLQLLFAEGCCERGFDVLIEGGLAVSDFSPNLYVPGTPMPTSGVVVTHQFFATDSILNILLGGDAPFGDENPILQGFTLELVPEPSTQVLLLAGVIARLVQRSRSRSRRA